jgi:hypothetical protein
VRLRYRDPRYGAELLPRDAEGWKLAARGELRKTTGGVTVGVSPGLVTVEGRLAAMLNGPDDHRLLPPAQLEEAVVLWADTLGVDADRAEVGRADVTGELRFRDGEQGRDLLAAMRSLDLPWLKIGTEGWKRDGLETVYARAARGRSVGLRIYDKGVESEQAAPGEWLRFERQKRFRKDRARTVAEFEATPMGEWFVGRELRRLVQLDDVVVCDRGGAVSELCERVGRGELGWQRAERIAGYVTLRGAGMPERTVRRRESELRALGISLDRNQGGRSRVPVGEHVRLVVESFDRLAA